MARGVLPQLDAAEKPAGYLSGVEALASFQLEQGLKIEAVVTEPLVVDPVAFAFDERRRLYVVENRGYPDPLPSSGEPKTTQGRIALLEDTDGDGRYERRSDFATGLGYPNGIMVWRGGVFVTAAPDVWYLKDNDGDGVADERRVVLTGFEDSKTAQLRVSYPTLGLDGWVYLAGGQNGGKVYSPAHPDRPPVVFSASDSRFHPDSLHFELVGGSSQFGLAVDDFGRRFGTTNRHPILQTVLESHDLKRNPHLAFNASVQEVSKVQQEAKVYPISGANITSHWSSLYRRDPTRVPHHGTFTSACGLLLFGGTGLAAEHVGNAFICEPAQNLIQRQILRSDGASFRADVAHAGREFLASTDIYFRPVYLGTGPDGALYVADMHRREIDHPLYIPEQARAQLDFVGPAGTGRIYRVYREESRVAQKDGLTTAQLCAYLESPESWWRGTAHRLLLERADPATAPLLEKIVVDGSSAPGRVRALWMLRKIDRLGENLTLAALRDRDAGVREQALLLARVFKPSASMTSSLLALADDSDARVRFMTALALGSMSDARVVSALAEIAVRDGEDRWTRAAVLSGIGARTTEFTAALFSRQAVNPAGFAVVAADLASVFGRGASLEAGRNLVAQLLKVDVTLEWCLPAIVNLCEGMQGRGDVPVDKTRSPLAQLLVAGVVPAEIGSPDAFVARMAKLAKDDQAPAVRRIAAIALLGQVDFERGGVLLGELLDARQSPALQLKAVQSLERINDPRGAELLLLPESWTRYSPQIRAAVISAVTSTPPLVGALFGAMERGRVKLSDIPPSRRSQLLRHADPKVREMAKRFFDQPEKGDRMEIYRAYRDVLQLPAKPKLGAEPFKRSCSVCHTYNGAGGTVGPDLTGTRNHSAEALLLHILVPNHEITPGYEAVAVTTRDGRTMSGWLASESENGITLRTSFDTEENVPRPNIATFTASGISLMPDGLEQSLTKEELGHIIAYLRQGAGVSEAAEVR